MVTRRVTAAAWCLWFPRCLPAPCRSGRTGKAQAARHAAHAQPPARARPCANAQGAAEGGQRAWTRASCRCVSAGRRASAATSHPATPKHQPRSSRSRRTRPAGQVWGWACRAAAALSRLKW